MGKISGLQGTFTLNNKSEMPYFGLGTFQSNDGEEVRNAVRYAINTGYRLIDTASFYDNEKGVGEGIRESDIPRDDVFVTTKVWNDDQGFEQALKAYDRSLDKLGMDYVDLLLVHWPVSGKFKDTWRAFEKIYTEGRVKAIGISNFLEVHLDQLLPDVKVMPMVNQMEFHPYLIQQSLLDRCAKHNIVYQAWSPIMHGKVFGIDVLKEIGHKYGKNEAQVVLRWDLQRDVATIPKSASKERIEQNAQIFDFELTDNDMKAINALDHNHRLGYDPMLF
ncbi:MAG: aldo/keto reductase [Prolixibacteraceae bacterium]|nr:aldo/keto reductase [Prolixibacteraceae bacterium]MBN2650054.1 aldo/keto reductase [Prolixibacteraceae bacterium]